MIKREHIESYLQCPYKAYLQILGHSGIKTQYETLFDEIQTKYILQAIQKLVQTAQSNVRGNTVILTTDVLKKQEHFVINGTITIDDFFLRIEAIERVAIPSIFGNFAYIPVTIIHKKKISKADKLLVAAIGVLLEKWQKCSFGYGKIIHGADYRISKVYFKALREESRKLLVDIQQLWEERREPQFMLISYCQTCEYQDYCRRKAHKDDHLSLLGGIRRKEITSWNNKGFFTVNQLSYAFRPRRRRKLTHQYRRPYHFELKSLAIRENKIYVYEIPEQLPTSKTNIYLDVEGLPDRDFYYLIGILVVSEHKTIDEFSLWANDRDEEVEIFRRFLDILNRYPKYTLYHYGSYERTFLKRMSCRVGGNTASMIEITLARSINLLSYFQSNIYLPTYTNGLKDVSQYLGFQWTDSQASGIQSIVWRTKWESNHATALKEKLKQYNKDDCYALIKVKELIDSLVTHSEQEEAKESQAIYCQDLSSKLLPIGKFVFPEIKAITKCSYFDYQRERVFARTDPAREKSKSNKTCKSNAQQLRPNRTISILEESCSKCQGNNLIESNNLSKKVIDLKFFNRGLRIWVTCIHSHRYECLDCKHTFIPELYKQIRSRYGHNLISWTIFENIVNKQSNRIISMNCSELFNFVLPTTVIYEFHEYIYKYYRPSYEQLHQSIVNSDVIYVDETPIKLKDEDGYGWVFTNGKEVIILYKPTREGGFLKEYLHGFTGILVSDFYPAYDSLDCRQQKCLIHLIRDLNNDLLKNPFDDEFKKMTRGFTVLLQSIVHTIDRYGLKRWHLRKHKKEVEQFWKRIILTVYTSEVALKYKKRFIKNEQKLFEFLDHDNVAWNNTNAEHAIKLLALHRNDTFKWFTETNITKHLKLISIYQTCVYNDVSFLKFLTSKEKDVIKYCQKHR